MASRINGVWVGKLLGIKRISGTNGAWTLYGGPYDSCENKGFILVGN